MVGSQHFPSIPRELETLLHGESLELFGICQVAGDDSQDGANLRAEQEYEQWISRGLHGEMEYLARNAGMKFRPRRVLPGCRSLVLVGMNYFQEMPEPVAASPPAPGTPSNGTAARVAPSGRVARYAWGRDYHNALGKRLKRIVRVLRERYPDHSFRSFVDASPLSERHFAARAGIGFTARNTLSVSGAYGSWFFLGEILTTLTLEPTASLRGTHGTCPSGCFRCGAACPTAALYAPHRIDASRCISYLTIEHRGRIDPELRPLMGDWVFGCDLCQAVCPLNLHSRPTTIGDFTAHRAGPRLRLSELLTIPHQTAYRERFAGTPLLRPGRDAMVRNACIAAANTGAEELAPLLRKLREDSSAVVREHARWALDRLGGVNRNGDAR
jgi:epoxyqueuosine reductase